MDISKIGLIEIEVRLVRKDELLVNKIMKARKWGEDKLPYVFNCLRYNILTLDQFSDLTGIPRSTISSLISPKVDRENGEIYTKIDSCYPFKNLRTRGQLFIIRNEKSEKYF